jgi:hypothetical protein
VRACGHAFDHSNVPHCQLSGEIQQRAKTWHHHCARRSSITQSRRNAVGVYFLVTASLDSRRYKKSISRLRRTPLHFIGLELHRYKHVSSASSVRAIAYARLQRDCIHYYAIFLAVNLVMVFKLSDNWLAVKTVLPAHLSSLCWCVVRSSAASTKTQLAAWSSNWFTRVCERSSLRLSRAVL